MGRHFPILRLLQPAVIVAVACPPLVAAEPDARANRSGPLGWLDRAPLADEPAAGHQPPSAARSPYIAGMIGSSFAGLEAGGLGGTLITGEGALGVSVPRPLGAVRFEVEGRQRDSLSGSRRAASGVKR